MNYFKFFKVLLRYTLLMLFFKIIKCNYDFESVTNYEQPVVSQRQTLPQVLIVKIMLLYTYKKNLLNI